MSTYVVPSCGPLETTLACVWHDREADHTLASNRDLLQCTLFFIIIVIIYIFIELYCFLYGHGHV